MSDVEYEFENGSESEIDFGSTLRCAPLKVKLDAVESNRVKNSQLLSDRSKQIFSAAESFSILRNELLRLISANPSYSVEAVDLSVYHWRISCEANCFSKGTPLRKSYLQYYGWSEPLIFEIFFQPDLHPFYPPRVRIISPRLRIHVSDAMQKFVDDGLLDGDLVRMDFLVPHLMVHYPNFSLQRWTGFMDAEKVISGVISFLEENCVLAASPLDDSRASNAVVYANFESVLAQFPLAKPDPLVTNVFDSIGMDSTPITFADVVKSNQENQSSTNNKPGKSCWKAGVGYSSQRKNNAKNEIWDPTVQKARELVRDEVNISVLRSISSSLLNTIQKLNNEIQSVKSDASSIGHLKDRIFDFLLQISSAFKFVNVMNFLEQEIQSAFTSIASRIPLFHAISCALCTFSILGDFICGPLKNYILQSNMLDSIVEEFPDFLTKTLFEGLSGTGSLPRENETFKRVEDLLDESRVYFKAMQKVINSSLVVSQRLGKFDPVLNKINNEKNSTLGNDELIMIASLLQFNADAIKDNQPPCNDSVEKQNTTMQPTDEHMECDDHQEKDNEYEFEEYEENDCSSSLFSESYKNDSPTAAAPISYKQSIAESNGEDDAIPSSLCKKNDFSVVSEEEIELCYLIDFSDCLNLALTIRNRSISKQNKSSSSPNTNSNNINDNTSPTHTPSFGDDSGEQTNSSADQINSIPEISTSSPQQMQTTNEISPLATNKTLLSSDESSSYLNWARDNTVDIFSENMDGHHFMALSAEPLPRPLLARLTKELAALRNQLTPSMSTCSFVRVSENDMRFWRVMIVGPEDTPYELGCFIFDIAFKSVYPNTPPAVHLATTGGGSVRFNPNLYQCGKVCLSLLGTWQGGKGEQWDPLVSTVYQLIMSIQALIFVEEPYYNEPGYQYREDKSLSSKYNAALHPNTVKYGILHAYRDAPNELKPIVKEHLIRRRADIMNLVESKWPASHFLKDDVKTMFERLIANDPSPSKNLGLKNAPLQ